MTLQALQILSDPLKLCQVRWGMLLHTYFQVSPGMFDQVQVRALAGHSETCIVLAVCLGSLSCWKVNLIFSKDLSVLCWHDARHSGHVSHDLRIFRCLLANSKQAVYWGVASVWPLYHKGLIDGVLQSWLSFWKVLPSPQRNSGALPEWPLGSWSPPWRRPFSSDCSVWSGIQLEEESWWHN